MIFFENNFIFRLILQKNGLLCRGTRKRRELFHPLRARGKRHGEQKIRNTLLETVVLLHIPSETGGVAATDRQGAVGAASAGTGASPGGRGGFHARFGRFRNGISDPGTGGRSAPDDAGSRGIRPPGSSAGEERTLSASVDLPADHGAGRTGLSNAAAISVMKPARAPGSLEDSVTARPAPCSAEEEELPPQVRSGPSETARRSSAAVADASGGTGIPARRKSPEPRRNNMNLCG